MENIPVSEITFDPTSYVDPGSRIFRWNGEIMRAISLEREQFYRELLKQEWFNQLQNEGLLVKTEVTQFTLESYPLVLKHQKVPFLTYCIEWSGAMLKEAALLTLDANMRIAEHNLTLQDAYPWNVYFDGTKPILIDFTSIVDADPNYLWKAYGQFCHFFLYPLYLHSIKKGNIARLLLTHYFDGVEDESFLSLLNCRQKIMNPAIFSRIVLPFYLDCLFRNQAMQLQNRIKDKMGKLQNRFNDSKTRIRFLTSLRKEVDSITIPTGSTHWSNYYQDRSPSLKDKDWDKGLEIKDRVISDILEQSRPKTVLDIGSNVGRYSKIAAEKGARVISWEKDESCVSNLYVEADKKKLNIIPLVMDFINPSSSFGWCAKQFPSAMERLRCEMVFCLALIHHLVFKQWQNFERIIEALDILSQKWVVIEFIPREDEYVQSCWEERFEWYSLENLIKCLESRFSKIQVFDSYPKGRRLLFCQK